MSTPILKTTLSCKKGALRLINAYRAVVFCACTVKQAIDMMAVIICIRVTLFPVIYYYSIVTFLIRPFPLSRTYMVPFFPMAMPDGLLNRAIDASPSA